MPVALDAISARRRAGHVGLRAHQACLADGSAELAEEEATIALDTRRLAGTTLELAWVAEVASAKTRHVPEFTGLAVGALALTLTGRVLAGGARVTKRRSNAALPVTKVTLDARRPASHVDLLTDLTRQAIDVPKVGRVRAPDAVVTADLTVGRLSLARVTLEAVDLTSLVGEEARLASLARNLTLTIHGRTRGAGLTQRRSLVALVVSKRAIVARRIAGDVDLSSGCAQVALDKLKVVRELTTGTLEASGLRRSDLVKSRLAEEAPQLTGLVCEPAGLAIGADTLTLARSILARGTRLTQRRAFAALEPAIDAIGASGLASDIDGLAGRTIHAQLHAKVATPLAARAVEAGALRTATLVQTRLAEKAALLSGLVGEFASVAIGANGLSRTITELASDALVAKRSTRAAHPPALDAGVASRLAGHIDLVSSSARLAGILAKLDGK